MEYSHCLFQDFLLAFRIFHLFISLFATFSVISSDLFFKSLSFLLVVFKFLFLSLTEFLTKDYILSFQGSRAPVFLLMSQVGESYTTQMIWIQISYSVQYQPKW